VRKVQRIPGGELIEVRGGADRLEGGGDKPRIVPWCSDLIALVNATSHTAIDRSDDRVASF
jgi:hypothetical protein